MQAIFIRKAMTSLLQKTLLTGTILLHGSLSLMSAEMRSVPPPDSSLTRLAVLETIPAGELTRVQAELISAAFEQTLRDSLHLPAQGANQVLFLKSDSTLRTLQTGAATEIGALTGADYVILNKAARKNALCAIRTDLIDSRSGEILKSWLKTLPEPDSLRLRQATHEHAEQVLTTLLKRNIISKIYGSIDVTTTPDSATIFIDGKLRGSSPELISGLTEGAHAIRIEKRGFAGVNGTIVIQAGAVRQFSTSLRRQAELRIYSVPEQAVVLINGIPVGTTPFAGAVPIGLELEISVQKKGFREWRKKVELFDDREFTISFREQTRKALWISSGALISATLTYYFLNRLDKRTNPGRSDLPGPPGRPE